MRRPLFWVCLFLVIVAILKCQWEGAFDRRGIRRTVFGGEDSLREQEMMVTGRIRKIERRGSQVYLWLKLEKNSWKDQLEVQGADAQTVAFSQQIFSCMQDMKTDRIRCKLEQREDATLPKMGSMVTVRGRFSFLEEATNPGEFNFAAYYQSLGVGGKLSGTEILSSSEDYAHVMHFLYELRERWRQRLEMVFPEREAGILSAMLLGEKSDLDPELKELYRDAGILHILSISGLHVTLLGMGLFHLLRRFGASQGVAAVAGGTVLVLYGLMTGMNISACRAIGMFLLRMLSVLWGRTYDLLTALAVMAALMLCTEPLYAAQSGFWLSFGALVGIGVVLPVLESLHREELGNLRPGESRAEKFIRRIFDGMEEGFWAGVSVFLATLPLLLLFYYEVPTFSMLINLMVIPFMGIVVGLGFLIMVLPGMGPLGFVVMLFLKWFECLCQLAMIIPFHVWNPGCPEPWQVIFYYLILALLLAGIWDHVKIREWIMWLWCRAQRNPKIRRKKTKGQSDAETGRKVTGSYKGVWKLSGDKAMGRIGKRFPWRLALLLPCVVFILPGGKDLVTFLDVGQGDCACIQTAEGQVWLSDCGSSDRQEIGKNILLPFLKYEGIKRIDGVFLSHADQDHTSGIVELLQKSREEGILVRCLVLPDWAEEHLEEFSEVLQASQKLRDSREGSFRFLSVSKEGKEEMPRILKMSAGDRLDSGRLSFLALHPQKQNRDKAWDANEESLCLLTTFQGKNDEWRLLLTGDVGGAGERKLLGELRKRNISEVQVLKCAHHGSRYATSEEFLKWMDARLTVISCGRRNTYGHPHEETLERLKGDGGSIFRTDERGAVQVQFARKGQFSVKGYLD